MPLDKLAQRIVDARAQLDAAQREREAKKQKRRERDMDRMAFGAVNYAAWDRSDPFTAQRCAAHIRCGVASLYRPPNQEYGIHEEQPGFYRADRYVEKRRVMLSDGFEEVTVVAYRNMARP